jgi:DNA-binding HxlR family transcriptional regulator
VPYYKKDIDMDTIQEREQIHHTFDVMDATCAARQLLDLIADKWTVLIIYALSTETRRYNELKRMVVGITNKMLTQTLRRLEAYDIIHREVYPEIPPRVEYSLTPLGRDLADLVQGLITWSENFLCTTPTGDRRTVMIDSDHDATVEA